MIQPFLPRADVDALGWMHNFAAGISADPPEFSLTEEDAASIRAAVQAFDAAYQVAIEASTRTCVTVNTKKQARRSAERICRQYASLIKNDWRVSDSDKIALGVRPRKQRGSSVPAPVSFPLLKILGATPGRQELRVSDSQSPSRVAKPQGAAELQLFLAVGDAPADDPQQARFHKKLTRSAISVGFEAPEGGKFATYFARWANFRGDVGPWSLPVSMRIAA